MEEFKCGICLLFLKECVQTHPVDGDDCHHLFCRKCLERGLEGSYYEPKCPLCRTILNAEEPFQRVPFIDRQLQDCKISCEKHCGWFGPMKELDAHPCPLEYTTCPFVGCQHQELQMFLPDHTKICMKRLVTCGACHKQIVFDQLQNHEDICPEGKEACHCCHEEIVRKNKSIHVAQCPKKNIRCPLCRNSEFKREDQKQHDEKYMEMHNEILKKTYNLGDFILQQIVNAVDFQGREYLARIVAIDPIREAFKVHFFGFADVCDEWIALCENRVHLFNLIRVQQVRSKGIVIGDYLGNNEYVTPTILNILNTDE